MRPAVAFVVVVVLAGCTSPADQDEWHLPKATATIQPGAALDGAGTLVIDVTFDGFAFFFHPIPADAAPSTRFRTESQGGFVYLAMPTVKALHAQDMPLGPGYVVHDDRPQQEVDFGTAHKGDGDAWVLTLLAYAEHQTRLEMIIEFGPGPVAAISPIVEGPARSTATTSTNPSTGSAVLHVPVNEGDTVLWMIAQDDECGDATLAFEYSSPAMTTSRDQHRERDEGFFWVNSFIHVNQGDGVASLQVDYHGSATRLPIHLANLGPGLQSWAVENGVPWSAGKTGAFHPQHAPGSAVGC